MIAFRAALRTLGTAGALVALLALPAHAFDMSKAGRYPSPDLNQPQMAGVKITPAPGGSLGVVLGQTLSGVTANPMSGNYLAVSDTAKAAPQATSIFWNMDHAIGAGVSGHRTSFQMLTHFNGPDDGRTTNPYYVNNAPTMNVVSGDGGAAPADGLGPTYATGRGAFFVTNPVLKATNAPNLQELSTQENNISCDASCSVAYKSQLALVALSSDKTQGRQKDDVITISAQPGAVGSRNLINISADHGAVPFNSGSTILRASGGAISTGIEFSGLTFLGNAWSSPGMTINGFGNIALQQSRAITFDLGAGINPGTHGGQIQGLNGTLYIDNWDAGVTVRAPLTLTRALIEAQSAPPASSSTACVTGQRAWDQNYEYRCVATNIWKRTPLSLW